MRKPDGFNPRTPCGVRQKSVLVEAKTRLFQSTHSLRSATLLFRGVREHRRVSIHALLAECDAKQLQTTPNRRSFNPRTPCGVRLIAGFILFCNNVVSIHALLAECDSAKLAGKTEGLGFNPRTPCGVRRLGNHVDAGCFPFQSTHSLRSATNGITRGSCPRIVSIHALLAECDNTWAAASRCWEVSIHALLAECDPGTRPAC